MLAKTYQIARGFFPQQIKYPIYSSGQFSLSYLSPPPPWHNSHEVMKTDGERLWEPERLRTCYLPTQAAFMMVWKLLFPFSLQRTACNILLSAVLWDQLSSCGASPLNTSPSNKPLVQVVFPANAVIEEMRVFYSLWRGHGVKGRLFRRVMQGYGFLRVMNQAVDKKQCAFREGVIWSSLDPGHSEHTAHKIRDDGHLGYREVAPVIFKSCMLKTPGNTLKVYIVLWKNFIRQAQGAAVGVCGHQRAPLLALLWIHTLSSPKRKSNLM